MKFASPRASWSGDTMLPPLDKKLLRDLAKLFMNARAGAVR